MSDYDDDFTGQNGDPPNPDIWEIVENTNDIGRITENKWSVNYYNSPYAPEDTTVDIRGQYMLTGDFDIKVNVLRYYIGTTTGYAWLALQIANYENTQFAYVGYFGGNSTYGVFSGDTDGTLSPHNRKYSVSTTDGAVLRLTRTSGVVKAYHWVAARGQWEGAFSDTNGWTLKSLIQNMRVSILQTIPAGRRYWVAFDDFLITSGDTGVLGPDIVYDSYVSFSKIATDKNFGRIVTPRNYSLPVRTINFSCEPTIRSFERTQQQISFIRSEMEED